MILFRMKVRESIHNLSTVRSCSLRCAQDRAKFSCHRSHPLCWRPQKYKEARMRFEVLLGRVGGPGQLHRWHVHAFDSLTPLMNACRATGDAPGSLQHATAVVAAIEGVQGQVPSVELGNYLELIGQVRLHLLTFSHD